MINMRHGIIARIEQDRFIPSLQTGNIHFSTNYDYQKFESNFNDHAIGAEEGIVHERINPQNIRLWNSQGKLLPKPDKVTRTYIAQNKCWISSWMYLSVDSWTHFPRKDEKEEIALKPEIIKDLKRLEKEKINFEKKQNNPDCKCSLIMMDWNTFINGIIKNDIYACFIKYRREIDPIKLEFNNELELFGYKPWSYAYQREIRLVLPDKFNTHHNANIFIPQFKDKVTSGFKINELNNTHFLF